MANDFLKIDFRDKSALYMDAIEKAALQSLRRVGKMRVEKMKMYARVKTGAMRAGVTSLVSKGVRESTLELGGTERKTPWIEYGTYSKGKQKTRPYPFVEPNLEGIDEEFAMEMVMNADMIKDLA